MSKYKKNYNHTIAFNMRIICVRVFYCGSLNCSAESRNNILCRQFNPCMSFSDVRFVVGVCI